ncbi:MAG: endopeptidase La [Tannerellaceae bacterium]|nr:endopeptidase La [Tannerellaceae bacterium]
MDPYNKEEILDEETESVEEIGDDLPILVLEEVSVFPHIVMNLCLMRPQQIRIVKMAVRKKQLIGVVRKKFLKAEKLVCEDVYPVGVVCKVVRIFGHPEGAGLMVVLWGLKRLQLKSLNPMDCTGRIELLSEVIPPKKELEFRTLMVRIRDVMLHIMKNMDPPKEIVFSVKTSKDHKYLLNFASYYLTSNPDEKQELLSVNNLCERAYMLLKILNRECQLMEIKVDIQMKTIHDMDRQQREFFLQQQLHTIQEELSGTSGGAEIRELRLKAKRNRWPQSVGELFEKELKRLEGTYTQSSEYPMQIQYLETLVDLPWGIYTKDNFNLSHVSGRLDRDHYGLQKVKERIIEHLAVLKLKDDMKSPILCLYGPPGVGKTSLGKSIAQALKRKYVRVSLGGLHDEAEIRGHRRTYIGAMCGRILQNLLKAKSSNPVFVLDEIDKVGNMSGYQGDPSSALLEVLDPEQNSTFHDNYLNVDYDLSKVMFIATANNINNISQPLLDRMELIEVNGYIMEEKVEIVRRHLLPKQIENHGLPKRSVRLPTKTLQMIIESYTRESGVRELDEKIAKIMRKMARKVAADEPVPTYIYPKDLKTYLGQPEYFRDQYQGNNYAGVVTGLAWTAVGGTILYVETSLSKGKGQKLTLTGNLGDVMKESAILALEYVHAHASLFGIPEELFEQWNVHIHVPEGAIPKDGPSAGITMTTSIVSVFTQRKVKSHIAMTGEITLRGKILPVGGIKEKILAAKRAGITEIILCTANEKDIDEITPNYLFGLNFHYVEDIREVITLVLLEEKVSNPLF